jgi:segregation and condensation protein B
MEDNTEIKNIVEALLFVADKPLSLEQIKAVLESDKPEIRSNIEQLKREYEQKHSFRIREVAGGYQIVTDPVYAVWLRKFFQGGRKGRLSKAALETLAIISYKQPITKPQIAQIRGVDVDGVIRNLLEKGLVKIAGRKDVIGKPLIYATTKRFLEYFGLNSLEELPDLDEFSEIEKEDNNEDNRDKRED